MKITRIVTHGPDVRHARSGKTIGAGVGRMTIYFDGGGLIEAVAVCRVQPLTPTEVAAIALGVLPRPPIDVVWYDRGKAQLVYLPAEEIIVGAEL